LNEIERATWEAALGPLVPLFQECFEERYQDMEKAHVEARKWKARGDMYGWNFHEGMAAGMNWADIIYNRLDRTIKDARAAAQGGTAA
jgi:hypothetical protein